MRRTEILQVRLTPKEKAAVRVLAKDSGYSDSEYCRWRILRNTRIRTRKGDEGRELAGAIVDAGAESREKGEQEQVARINRELREQQERENKAILAAKAAGGVERWFAGMTQEQQAEWSDLKEKLLASEKQQREADAVWQAAFGKTSQEHVRQDTAPRQALNGNAGPEVTILDNGMIL